MARAGVFAHTTPLGAELHRKLRRFRTGEAARIARDAVARRALMLIDEGFQRRTDPRGRGWAPRVPPTGAWPLLEKKGRMRAGYDARVRGAAIKIENSALSDQGRPYPLFHQHGTRKMEARKHVPEKALSRHWRAEIAKVIVLALEKL